MFVLDLGGLERGDHFVRTSVPLVGLLECIWSPRDRVVEVAYRYTPPRATMLDRDHVARPLVSAKLCRLMVNLLLPCSNFLDSKWVSPTAYCVLPPKSRPRASRHRVGHSFETVTKTINLSTNPCVQPCLNRPCERQEPRVRALLRT
jgi:hypothetical protein